MGHNFHKKKLSFEFYSGNWNGSREYQFSNYFCIFNIVVLLLTAWLPLRAISSCVMISLRKLAQTNVSGHCRMLAVTVGSTDIYYQNVFSESQDAVLLHMLPMHRLYGGVLSVDQFASFRQLIREMFISPVINVRSLGETFFDLPSISTISAKLAYLHQALSEIHTGNVTNLRLLDMSIRNFIQIYPSTRVVIIPLEGRTWEKIIIRACRASNVKTVGYVHGALNGNHRGILGSEMASFFPPDCVVCCGEYFRKLMINADWAASNIRVMPYLRYQQKVIATSNSRRIVIFLSGNIYWDEKILSYFGSYTNSNISIQVSMNPRGTSHQLLQERAKNLKLATWDGKFSPNTVVLTRSLSLLIEVRQMLIPAGIITFEHCYDNNLIALLDSYLMQGRFHIEDDIQIPLEKILKNLELVRLNKEVIDYYLLFDIDAINKFRNLIKSF